MKNKKCLITIIFMIFLLAACSKKEYVVFKYNCKSINDYKCELKKKRLYCDVKRPTCDGYEFVGWYDSKENGNEVDLYSEFKNKDIIYAQWKEKEGLSTEEESGVEEISSQASEEESSIEEQSSLVEEISSQEVYTITFNGNGGSTTISSKSVTYNESLPTIWGLVPTRTGYTFMGWYDNVDYTNGKQYYDSSNSPLRKYDKKSNVILYARWKANTYIITYNPNGGNVDSSFKNAAYNQSLPSLGSIPTKDGYQFMGWYDAKTGGNKYYDELNNAVIKKYDKTSNITLYARWKETILSITYNGNSATSWNPAKNTYSVNVDGTVIFKDTQEIYKKELKYKDKLDSTGLVDYNGEWFNWSKDGYYVKEGKEYLVAGTSTRLDQNKAYDAKTLASYANCDLSKKDCTIVLKVNWKKIVIKKRFFIGDSRTVGMAHAVTANTSASGSMSQGTYTSGIDTWSCKSAEAFTWMRNVGIPNINSKLDNESALIILMGANDYYNDRKDALYTNYFNEKLPTWNANGVRVYFVSVMPCTGRLEFRNSEYERFNAEMKKISGLRYIDAYNYMMNTGFVSPDDLHYDDATYIKIYNYIINNLND